MGRKPKVENAQICTLRLPKEFVSRKPANEEFGDWLRSMLPLNGNSNNFTIVQAGITDEQKDAVRVFVNLFNNLLDKGKLDDVLTDDVISAAENLQGMLE